MTDPLPRLVVRLAESGHRRDVPVRLAPGAAARAAVAEELGILGVERLALEGRLVPEGRADWRLDARLAATVVQECGVTLDPVSTALDEPVLRRYVAGLSEPGAGEHEMGDDESEPLPAALDLGEVMLEALALALPPFPRAPGAEAGDALAAAPGAEPLTDEAIRPFAGLDKALKRPD